MRADGQKRTEETRSVYFSNKKPYVNITLENKNGKVSFKQRMKYWQHDIWSPLHWQMFVPRPLLAVRRCLWSVNTDLLQLFKHPQTIALN
jgi:hypothetical protein